MKAFELPLKKFDLVGYLKGLEHLPDEGMGLAGHVQVFDPDGLGEDELGDDLPELALRIVTAGGAFVPFHSANVDGVFACLDGREYELPLEEDEDGNANPEWDDIYDTVPSDAGALGHLLNIEGETLRIEPAVTDVDGHIDALEEEDPDQTLLGPHMDAYVKRFMRR
jgi:hypothetical protein